MTTFEAAVRAGRAAAKEARAEKRAQTRVRRASDVTWIKRTRDAIQVALYLVAGGALVIAAWGVNTHLGELAIVPVAIALERIMASQ